ncbi:MAG TPA: hypothetical protein VFS63_14900 [Pseudolabrys sp.]|jgi:hypothetical protein|nr:hypothetical protein [Pseudolabrys sp.]
MNTTKGAERNEDSRRERQSNNLDGRYHAIGISAVAAAVRFQSETRNPAYAPDTNATARAFGYVGLTEA